MIDENNYWIKHLKRNNIGEIRGVSFIIEIDVSKILDNKVFDRVLDSPNGEIDEIQMAARELVNKTVIYKPLIRFINISKKILIKDLSRTKMN